MHEKLLALPGTVEVLVDGKPLAGPAGTAGGKLYRICAAVPGRPAARTYHVLYALADEAAAQAYWAANAEHIAEHGTLQREAAGKRWYARPQRQLASNSDEVNAAMARVQAALVVWQEGALLHKLFCSEVAESADAEAIEAAQRRAAERCAELLAGAAATN